LGFHWTECFEAVSSIIENAYPQLLVAQEGSVLIQMLIHQQALHWNNWCVLLCATHLTRGSFNLYFALNGGASGADLVSLSIIKGLLHLEKHEMQIYVFL